MSPEVRAYLRSLQDRLAQIADAREVEALSRGEPVPESVREIRTLLSSPPTPEAVDRLAVASTSSDRATSATSVVLRLTITAEEAGVVLREDSVTQAADESDDELLTRAVPLIEIVRGTPSRVSSSVELPETHSQDIPHLAFTRDGSYDLSTPERQLAAAEAALRSIAIVPQAYHARGPEWCREDMARQAALVAQRLRWAREAPQGATAPAPRRLAEHATMEFIDPPWMPEVGDDCEVQLDVTGDRWWRVRYLGRGHGTSPQAIRVSRGSLDMPSLGVVTNLRRIHDELDFEVNPLASLPWMPKAGDPCEIQLDITGERWWHVRYLGYGRKPWRIRVHRLGSDDMPTLGIVSNLRRIPDEPTIRLPPKEEIR